jgi:hypothetical protein
MRIVMRSSQYGSTTTASDHSSGNRISSATAVRSPVVGSGSVTIAAPPVAWPIIVGATIAAPCVA